jgi:chromosome segregation ATPase
MDISDRRQDRIEDAIERLTEISADLNKMLAVHEQKLIHQEKAMINIEDVLERRRQELELKLTSVYQTMRDEDKSVLTQLEKMRKEQKDQHDLISNKISTMEKIMWTNVGGVTLVGFLLAYGHQLLELLVK